MRRGSFSARVFGGLFFILFSSLAILYAFMRLEGADSRLMEGQFYESWEIASRVIRESGVALVIALLAAAVATWGIRRLWSRPLIRLLAAARQGETALEPIRIPRGAPEEIAKLARYLNDLRVRLQEAADKADHQRRTHESLLSQIHEGVIVVRADGRVAMINSAAVSMLGLSALGERSPEAFVGRTVEQCIQNHDLQQMFAGFARGATARQEGGGPSSQPYQEARVRIVGDEGERELLARAGDILLPAPSGQTGPNAPGRLLVMTDITELTRLLSMKTEFVANASHELRTPVATIRAAVEALMTLPAHERVGGAKPFLDVIDRQSGRLGELAGDLLDLSRLESPAPVTEQHELDLRYELEELRSRFAQRLEEKRIEWREEVEGAVPARIWADGQLLRMILDNLVDNAMKFTEAGGRVCVGCVRVKDGIAMSVSDTGCGIPAEHQARVFERFFQVERSRSGQRRGTGLGLSIVRHAVAAMAGTVELRSEVGVGTTVTFSIPQPE